MTHRSRTSLYAFVLILSSLIPTQLWAERYLPANKPATEGMKLEESDSIQLFRGVAVSYNLAGTIMRLVSDYGEFEAGIHANLRDRYFPTFEAGIGSAKHELDAITGIEAKTVAPFFRLGCDFNIAKNKHDDYRVLLGARYAFTFFNQKASGEIKDPYWGGTTPYTSETSCNFHWAELLFALDARLWGPVRLGWSVRYKLKLAGSSKQDGQELWYVPGFGKSSNSLGGTFNVTVELGRKNKRIR